MKRYIFIAMAVLLGVVAFAGCNEKDMDDIDAEVIETFEVIKSDTSSGNVNENSPINEKFESIDFYLISGIYSRNVIQEDIEILEMFALDRTNFVRIMSSDLEREVFAYNYMSDEFTYLYYFDGELMSKTVINLDTGKVVEDKDNYAPMLKEDAQQLKEYFYSLIDIAQIDVTELKD